MAQKTKALRTSNLVVELFVPLKTPSPPTPTTPQMANKTSLPDRDLLLLLCGAVGEGGD
jgi:hypothetical protein